ncbi:SGNH/GDSL hydrolase family protein [Rathayibacter iranicus]|uniref:SGNH hydrolase-type esterase domain-containing protein n=2 Tax=Rathayibacter iranicus TaxID=59737 RepID=A0AAD1AGL4_9MICO|nr:GDSL-type esterase/lipase family protein [Rathayibacter iranicus]AZZ55886.1 hypothetical protein C7V51_08370 [Rathayibacter iranicus]MWV30673.1 hypothetical protein [Rathayibacter iranicus NCPPB 2253 = VKM Ac-1602]PPI47210.1 hypothetical protein C5E09_07405 [Rathayibacter iranicus]PPI60253.1 hypothetical protein C5E08_08335 [Rathayibacter iranicus]PPI71718.1 hypothetical protein C5E01_07375 [Rathayibacter iranicus]
MRKTPTIRPSSKGVRRALAAGAAVAFAAALVPAQAASAATPGSLSVVGLGDSLTQAFASCDALENCPTNSWSTGTNPAVDSFASRLGAAMPGVAVTTENYASSGDVIAQVPSRIDAAIKAGVHADVVTLLIGGNDLCAPNVPVASDGYTMTPASTFAAEASAAITKIRTTWPSARIVLSSMPNVAGEWSVMRSGSAPFYWAAANACRTTRGVDSSGAALSPEAAEASAAAAQTRTAEYNSALQSACSADGPLCDWDGGAMTAVEVQEKLISTTDYFHPNVEGQAKIASIEWAASDFAKKI